MKNKHDVYWDSIALKGHLELNDKLEANVKKQKKATSNSDGVCFDPD